MPLAAYTVLINPYGAVIYLNAEETDTASDVLSKFWKEWGDRVEERFPKLKRAEVKLLRLLEPLDSTFEDQVSAQMRKYDTTKKQTLRPHDVIGPYDPDHLTFEIAAHPWVLSLGHKKNTVAEDLHDGMVQRIREAPSPSQIARSIHTYKAEHEKGALFYNGRPLEQSAAPVSVYNLAFAKIQEKLNNLNEMNIRAEVTSFYLAGISQLFRDACELYDDEKAREQVVMNQIRKLLEISFEFRHDITTAGRSAKVTQADGVHYVLVKEQGLLEREFKAIDSCFELKNELGLGGLPDVQLAVTYEKAISQDEYTAIRAASCCPAVLINVCGPYIRFYGAVLAEVCIVQPFTDYIFLGGDPGDVEDRLVYAAKVFAIFREGLAELRDWYEKLHFHGDAIKVSERIFPSPTYAADAQSELLKTLRFVDRFDYGGSPPTASGRAGVDLRRSLFLASLNNHEVLVKFCSRYGEKAHRELAKRNPPLAPKLHACVRLVGGTTMVVMDIVPGKVTAASKQYAKQPLPSAMIRDVETALKALHEKGLVHGDVRRPNIMAITRDDGVTGAMLVDFDWAGENGKVFYPIMLNLDIAWAQGVQTGQAIRPEHDWSMFRNLGDPRQI
ncbi:hypothetical protein BN946_scf184910.g4 [Trametes cinnabarina]|uniref:Protein kinase domain-containing protein n=1 Tax=Pycnoporus cinnabarinus TaxID=5643 RepID=A0A060SAX0_PYCCI|nr:hypothetical protein BN946_scf184910.g4 [Trametes cinnabarina]